MQKYGTGCKNMAFVSPMARGCNNKPRKQGREKWTARGGLKNFHIFDFAINGVVT